jgi:hypothetical protein
MRLLLLRPEALPTATAILFRAMVPLYPETQPNLSSVRVWIGAETNDPIIPMSETKALDQLLRNAGADVTIRYFQAGHELTMGNVEFAREWLRTSGYQRQRSFEKQTIRSEPLLLDRWTEAQKADYPIDRFCSSAVKTQHRCRMEQPLVSSAAWSSS